MEVKGTAIKWIPKYIKKKFGKKGFEQWLDAISAEAYTIYSIPVADDDWFSLKTAFVEPMANIAQLFYSWDLQKAAWEIGRHSADITLKGVVKMFVKMNSVDYFVAKMTELLPTYYKPCAMEVVERTEGTAVVRITEFPGMDKAPEFRLAGWGERALEITGAKDVNVDITRAISNRDPYTEFKITWIPK